jgi:hypothetical protein
MIYLAGAVSFRLFGGEGHKDFQMLSSRRVRTLFSENSGTPETYYPGARRGEK